MSRWLAGVCVLLFSACQIAPPRPAVHAQLDALAEHLHSAWGFDGAFAVSDGAGIRWERGVGYAEAAGGAPFTPATASDGGSMAKTFTAAAVFLLAHEGKLGLDDPVTRHLPGFPWPGVTLRHLLAHSSGLPDYGVFDRDLKDRVASNELLLELLARRRLEPAFPPGARFEYSSLGYDFAALVVERVTGESYERFLRRRVFEPLGMTDAFVRPARFRDWRSVRTVGYTYKKGVREPLDAFDLEGFYGGSNLYLSARDLDRWSRGWIEGRVLPAAAGAGGRARAAFPGGLASGLTLLSWYDSEDGTRAWYPGHWQGFYSMAFRDHPRRRSIAYVTNTNPPMWLRPLIVREVNRLLDGGAFRPLERPDLLAVDPKQPGVVAGRHRFPGIGTFELVRRDGKLYGRLEGRPELRVYALGPEVLVAPGYDAWLWFTRDGAGGRQLHWNTVLASIPGVRER